MDLGIDVGGTSIKLVQTEWGGSSAVASARVAYQDEVSPAVIARAIALGLHELGPEGASRPGAIGLCVPGVVNPDSGVIERAVNLPGIEGLRVEELLPRCVAEWMIDVSICTDAHAAAVGHRLERAEPPGRLAVIAIGSGVGLCVMDDFEPLRVSGASSGHLGQVDVGPCAPGGAVSRDGARDTLEAYVGVSALRARFGADLPSAIAALTPDDPACAALVRAMRIVHAIYRPRRIALLGGIGRRFEPLGAGIRERTSDGLTGLARSDWTLEFGSGDFLAARGAAWVAGNATSRGS